MLDAMLDVGGVYDPSRDRYDHHQKGFNELFGHGFTTKLSASGLVYKHYGMEIIAHQLQLDVGDQNVRRLFIAVYKNFVEAIDAIDNGINQYDTDQPPKYANTTSLSSRIARLNLDWMDHDQTPERENEAFQHAMTLAGSEYLKNVQYHAKSWLPARSIVMEYLSARWITDPSGEIMTLYTFCPANLVLKRIRQAYLKALPLDRHWSTCSFIVHTRTLRKRLLSMEWKLHLFELEEEMKIDPPIKYVLYQDDRNKRWRVQAVAVSPDKFESRKALPSPWRGLNDDELSKEAGIPGCVFVHASGFIGGNHSYHGALAMARTALQF